METREIPVELLISSRNVRSEDSIDVTELTESIREHGILQPIRVRPTANGRFHVIAGHRRLAAARRLGLATIPGVIVDEDDKTAAVQTIVENLQREDLSPADLAKGVRELETSFGMSHPEIAKSISKSVGQVRSYLRLAYLPQDILDELESGEGRTQIVRGLTKRHVEPFIAGIPIGSGADDAVVRSRVAEASSTIHQLKDELESRGARINAHMADAIGRSIRDQKMTVREAVDDVLSRPDDFRYSKTFSSPEALESDTWAAYKRLQRDLAVAIYRLKPEVAASFGSEQQADLMEQLRPTLERLEQYTSALESRRGNAAAEQLRRIAGQTVDSAGRSL